MDKVDRGGTENGDVLQDAVCQAEGILWAIKTPKSAKLEMRSGMARVSRDI